MTQLRSMQLNLSDSRLPIVFAAGLAVLSGAIVAVLPPSIPKIYLLAVFPALALCLVILRHPEIGLVTVLVSLYNPLVSLTRLNLAYWSYIPTFTLLGITTLAIIIHQKKSRFYGDLSAWRSIYTPAGIFVVYCGVAALVGVVRGNSLDYVISDFIQMLELPLVYWLTLQVLRRSRRPMRIAVSVLTIFTITVGWNLVLYFTSGHALSSRELSSVSLSRVGEEIVVRAPSDIPALFLPVLLALLLLAYEQLSSKWRYIAIVSASLTALTVVLSFTRSIWGGQVVALLTLLALSLRLRQKRLASRILIAIGVAALVIAIMLVAVNAQGQTLSDLVRGRLTFTVEQITEGNRALDLRLYEYTIARYVLAASPLLGQGLGYEYIGYKSGGDQAVKHWLHNAFLAQLIRTGLIGIILLISFLGATVSYVLRHIKHQRDPIARALSVGVIASLLGLLFQSLFWGTLFSHPNPAFLGFGLGLAIYVIFDRNNDLNEQHKVHLNSYSESDKDPCF